MSFPFTASMIIRPFRLVPSLTRFSSRSFTYSVNNMAGNNANEMVSETMKAEGGPAKGSTAVRIILRDTRLWHVLTSLQAQMQSAVDTERNFEETAQEIMSRMQNDPASITSEVSTIVNALYICSLTQQSGRRTPQVPRGPRERPSPALVRLHQRRRATPRIRQRGSNEEQHRS